MLRYIFINVHQQNLLILDNYYQSTLKMLIFITCEFFSLMLRFSLFC